MSRNKQTHLDTIIPQRLRHTNKTVLEVSELENRITPYTVNVGSVLPSGAIVYDDGIASATTLQSNGTHLASDLSDAIGLVNTLPQGGNGGSHQIFINAATVYIQNRLPTLVAQTVITGNSAISTTYTPASFYPGYEQSSVVTSANLISVGNFRVLHSISNSLSLKGLTLNGSDAGNGGAVLFEGTDLGITLHGCYITGRVQGNGGGIYSTRQVNAVNCYFYFCTANNGGAIYMTSASVNGVSLIDTRFSDNSAVNNGGSVWISTLGYLSITDCGFLDAEVGGSGGFLYVWESNSTDISSSFFDESFAGSVGVMIFLNHSKSFSLTSSLLTGSFDYDDNSVNAIYGTLDNDPFLYGNSLDTLLNGYFYYFIVLHPTLHIIYG